MTTVQTIRTLAAGALPATPLTTLAIIGRVAALTSATVDTRCTGANGNVVECGEALALRRSYATLISAKPVLDALLAFTILVLGRPVARRWYRRGLATTTGRGIIEALLKTVAVIAPQRAPLSASQLTLVGLTGTLLIGPALLPILQAGHATATNSRRSAHHQQ